jgi:Flp pilus assembly protein TadG
VALMTGIMLPVMVMSLAMGVEVTSWSVTKLELQRIADVSAWAGAAQYASTQSAQSATKTAADLAEINGASGTTARTWNATTLTATDNMITAQVVSGVRSASNVAVKVTVRRTITKLFSRIFPSDDASVTVSATAIAEIGSLGPQPCITALGGGVDGITTGTDLSVGGNASLVAIGCSLRSNDGISQSNNGTINAGGVYAGGNISGPGVCCDVHANAGQISDPYATNAPLQNALELLNPGSGAAISVNSNKSQSIGPGTYSGWDVNGTLNLSPGLYVVNGNISSGAQATISGTGVTIVMSGAVSTTGGSQMALTAPTTSPTGTAVPGILIAGKSSASMAFLGNSAVPFTGVIYLPNASLKFGGTSQSGSNGCSEVIASTVTLVGTSNLAANCSGYGTLKFGSLPGTSSIALVQ